MLPEKLLIAILLTSIDADMLDVLRPKIIKLYKMEGSCPGHENAPVKFQNIHMSYLNKIHMISLEVIVTEYVSENLKVKLDLKRCRTREALDSCEKYQTIVITHLCKILTAENKPWTPFVKLSEPPMSCPLKKGIHVVKNGTFDGSVLSHLPIAGWYWIVTSRLLGQQSNRVIMCVQVEGQIAPV